MLRAVIGRHFFVLPHTAAWTRAGADMLEGQSAVIGFTFAGGTPAAGTLYSFDYNGDGVFDVVNSASPTVTLPANLTADGDAVFNVHARLTAPDNRLTDFKAQVVVHDVAPFAPTDRILRFTVVEGRRAKINLVGTFDAVTTRAFATLPRALTAVGPAVRTVHVRVTDKTGHLANRYT